MTSKITNNTTNNTYINSNSKNKPPKIEPQSQIKKIKFTKKNNTNKTKAKKGGNYLKEKIRGLQNLNINEGKIKNSNNNTSFNNASKKPKKINTENNINNNKKKFFNEKIKINNYTTNNNDHSNSYIKIKIQKEKKDNKNNISNYDKRRNYNVPKLRIKKTAENDTKKNDTTEVNDDLELKNNEKDKNVQRLLENNSYIKLLQQMMENSSNTRENKIFENKKKYIEENGYDLQNIEDEESDSEKKEENNENNEEINKDNNINKEKNNKNKFKNVEIKNDNNININNIAVSNNSISNNNSSNINNYNFISNNNINMNLSGSSEKNINIETENNKRLDKRKQIVNTNEYMNKINLYMKNIPVKQVKYKKDYYNNINTNKDSLHDSFRRSISNSAKKIKKEKKTSSENSSTDSETKFNFKTKENKRSETEIKEYIVKKKREKKLKEEKENKTKQAKKFNRYLVLNKLNEDIISNMNKNMSKINEEKNKNKNMKEKIPNEFYIGKKEVSIKRKNSNISHTTESSQSTVLDQNNYYLDLIMSKNILANNLPINNIYNEINDENDNNIVTTTKDKDIQNTFEINTNNSNNKLSQEIIKNIGGVKDNKDIYGELKIKCKEAINRANHLFNEKNMQELIKQYKDNNNGELNNNNNDDINNNDNNNFNNNIIETNNGEINNIIIDENKKEENINENNENIIPTENKEPENITEVNNDINNNNNNDNKNDINIKENKEEPIIIKEEENPKEETKEEIPVEKKEKKTYEFSPEILENYNNIFISIDDYLNSLIKKNAINDIISYGDSRIAYKVGLENLVIFIKSYPFNELKNIYQRQYYKDVLRQFFIPYIRKAFNNINLYGFYLTKFSEINKAIEQIYRIVFIKRLIFYGQMKSIIKKEFNEKINQFIQKIRIIKKKFFFKIFLGNLNPKENDISENNSFSRKYNTYLYESFSEKSSLTAYPNTEGSARLHKVYELLEMQRKPKNEENDFMDNNSIRSVKSVEEKKGKNFFNKLKENDDKDKDKENNDNNIKELIDNLNKEENNIIKEIKEVNLPKKSEEKEKENIEIINNENNDNYKGCIKKIEITNNFKINKNNTINISSQEKENEENNINNNINNNNNIIIETNEKKSRNNNITDNKEKNNEIPNIPEIISDSKSNNNTNTNDILSLNLNLSNSFKKEKETSEINNNRYPTNSERNEINNKKELIEDDNNINKIIKNIPKKNIDNITDELCQNIIGEIILSEIKDKKKLLQKKKKEINASLNNSSCSIHISQNSMSLGSHSPGRNYPPPKKNSQQINNESYPVNTSQTESVLNNSIFMRTVDEIIKEKNLKFYNDKISNKFLSEVEKNLEKNYESIIDNIKNPFIIDEEKMINGLMLKDKSLSASSKIKFCNENILKKNNFLDNKIISDFESIDKEIRNKNNYKQNTKENILYDNYLNKCIFDTINELIEKERKYGIIGSPLSWSIRSKDIDYKYRNKDNFSKKIFINKIMNEINKILNSKMGLIAENYEYLDMEQLNQDRDKKFMESIKQELKESEPCYQIFETQETYVKLSLSRIILDQLLNEIVEILEHVQYSRKEPDKYQSKSIYACEDIPRLSFQPQTMENNYSTNLENDDGDESINQ